MSNYKKNLVTSDLKYNALVDIHMEKSELTNKSTNYFTGFHMPGSTSYDSSGNMLPYKEPKQDPNFEVSKKEVDLSFILRKRLEQIQYHMTDFDLIIKDFSVQADKGMENFIRTMSLLQKNLNIVHKMSRVTEQTKSKDSSSKSQTNINPGVNTVTSHTPSSNQPSHNNKQ